ncbi:MAG: DNA translocase FtsK 4TM domain-containing protein [Candidatus Omnitrophica bacterium]|nr:DNA translocase FtsK 4TM domain-containing protein [Candidatus Omnitrophota bacterium]
MKNLSSFLKSTTLFFISIILFLSLFSYTPRDISFLTYPPASTIHNFIGIFGAYLAFGLFFVFGYAAYFFSFYFFCLALGTLEVCRFSGLGRSKIVNVVSFSFFIIFLSAFIGLFIQDSSNNTLFKSAGVIGWYLAGFARKYLGIQGSFITVGLLLVVNALLLFGYFFVDLFPMARGVFTGIGTLLQGLRTRAPREERKLKPVVIKDDVEDRKKKNGRSEAVRQQEVKTQKSEVKPEIKFYNPKPSLPVKPKELLAKDSGDQKTLDEEAAKKKMEALEGQVEKKFDPKTYKLPTYDLLKVPPALDYREVKEDIEASITNLEETLADFGVEVKVVSVQKGPVVTMYELEPAAGVKIQKISALADDIALAMKSSSVRVVAPIPGRGTVGVEVPNEKKHLVSFREVLEEKAFITSPSKLTLTIGKDVSGNAVVADLKDMPHLLIAGTTGSGKTVCVNSLISSILFKAKPDEVKFILIDPKMVELAHFSGIPHLLHPLIFEAKKAFVALNWAVEEMERRYQLLAGEGARNIDAYNKNGNKMPYIVVIVDELADLMVVAKENIETAIQRLAQLSRAVGIHLVLATQRPSVDVITGVIKANFPARISFKVSSKVDSRTVLDSMGADKLIGKGDLLFLKPGAPKLIRAQGCYVDDDDIDNLTAFVRGQGGPVYEEGIAQADAKGTMNVEQDELFEDAIKTILQARQASASILQRRMRVGYTRAARLLDLMEQAGIVGPFCGSKAREILVDPEGYQKEKGWIPS